MSLDEATIEDAALTWFGGLGYAVLRRLDIAPGGLAAEDALEVNDSAVKVLGEPTLKAIC